MAVPKLGGRLPPSTARLAVPPKSNRIAPTMGARRCLRTIAWLIVAFSLTGCSTFERDWHAARLIPRLEDDVAGRWEGTWRSEANGHNDQLRAVITKGSNDVYLTRFHARYKKGIFRFSFGYSVPLQVRQTNDTYQFHGEADLGWLAGGLYRYEGSATGTNFFSTYHCKYDHGTFQMGRPSGFNRP
jgi:hypothetical protein